MKFSFQWLLFNLVLGLGASVASRAEPLRLEPTISNELSAVFLTPSGAKKLTPWNMPIRSKKSKALKTEIELSVWLDAVTAELDLNDRADIDLITFRGASAESVVRVPRFMIVRDWLRLTHHAERGYGLRVTGKAKLEVPASVFEIQGITTAELVKHSTIYKGIRLSIRTNPAASRGEKLFLQNCLSCHGTPRTKSTEPIQLIQSLTAEKIQAFPETHGKFQNLKLMPRDIRGLEAYRDALKQ